MRPKGMNYFKDDVPEGNFVAFQRDGSYAAIFCYYVPKSGEPFILDQIGRHVCSIVDKETTAIALGGPDYNRWLPLPEAFNFKFVEEVSSTELKGINYFKDVAPKGNFVAFQSDGSCSELFCYVPTRDEDFIFTGKRGTVCSIVDKETTATALGNLGHDRWLPLPKTFNFRFLRSR